MTGKIKNLDEIKEADINKGILEQDYILEIYNDDYQSPFQCLKIETWEQLEWLIKETKIERENGNFIFRGQKDCHWKPISSLEREAKELTPKLISNHFKNFKKFARGRTNEQFILHKTGRESEQRELWALGQHIGLKTPLLDWSWSIFVGLFFAFEEDRNETPYRSVFCLNYERLCPDKDFINGVFEPIADPIGRLTAQQGLFVMHNVIPRLIKGDITLSRKYLIAENLQKNIIDYLDFIGIKMETLFPDIYGAAKKANSILFQEIYKHKKER
ncbi:FRG domain-containing protein [Avibacterium sp. 21-594]|uniref:FRG domain-containing protein n=1 Tax=Avibacterium sp. 21-594 TaxID=2911535 RepID=UPI002247C1FC|nr:FRG domain-containing protein [Avibacterium sp. 21-594]MCW9715170.1 FRG domain-containing protein [Avibacterium sp. 21-594]